jgi:hypothetical protein
VFSDLCRAARLEEALRVAEAAVKAQRDDVLIRRAHAPVPQTLP